MDKGMNLSGQLADWPIDELIQIIQVTKKTGSLELQGTEKGRVHFRQGKLTGAELHGSQGVYAGTDVATIADIVFVLGSMDEGTFAMGPDNGPDGEGTDPADITNGVDELRALESGLKEDSLLESGLVAFVSSIDKPVTFEPAQWAALASLIPVFSIDSLEAKFGRGGAVRTLYTLNSLALIEASGGRDGEANVEGESTWLNLVAGEVAGTGPGVVLDDDHDVRVEIAVEGPPRHPPLRERVGIQGVAADPSTVLTDGVFDEIRRLRSKPS